MSNPSAPARLVLAGTVVAALALGGCARPPESTVDAAGAARPAAVAAGPTLPTLPPAEQRSPQQFDERGCLRTGPASADCASGSAAIDAAAAGHQVGDWRTLAGFVGRGWTTDTSRQALVVLPETVAVGTDGLWSARGIVRNEQAGPVAGVDVRADLLAADGHVIETVTGTSPVTDVRPGEPVPFEVHADVAPTGAVAQVRWSAVPSPGTAGAGSRDLELSTYWTRGFGEPRRVDLYLHHDPVAGPVPYVLFGSVVDRGRAVAEPRVTIAWVDAAGRVVAVRQVPLADPGGGAAPGLGAGEARDFLAAVDDPVAGPALADATPMLWGAGR